MPDDDPTLKHPEPAGTQRAGPGEATEKLERLKTENLILLEHSARTLVGLRLTAFGSLICAVLIQLVRVKRAVHWPITGMLILLCVTSAGFAIWTRKDRVVPPYARFGIGVMIAVTTLLAVAYLGVISSTTLILCTVVYAYAVTDWPVEAWVTFGVCAGGYLVVALLSYFGVLPLTDSVLALQKENTRALVGLTILAEMIFGLTFWFAWRGRRVTRSAIELLAEARMEAEKRAALLAEAREDLRQVVDAGRLGRLTGQSLDDFQVGEVIGRGAMGEVYAATRAATGDPVALKLLHPHLVDNTDDVQRFEREMRITAALRSRHVVQVLATGTAPDGSPYLAMEWLPGSDLAALLRDGPLALRDAVVLVQHVAEALAAAKEAGIVHRDVKPQNLFRVDGDHTLWKVLDFGVSRFVDLTSTLTQGAIGTPAYMAPEQCKGVPVDHRADVFALAAVAYRSLTGRPAFSANDHYTVIYRIVNEQPVRPSDLAMLPLDVDLALALGLAKDRDQRFDSAPAFAEALAAASHNALAEPLRQKARGILTAMPWATPS